MESSSYEDMFRLRQEYLNLQRCLQSGQGQLHDSVQLLKASAGNTARRLTTRSMNYCQIKTSTPKLSCPEQSGKGPEKRDTSKFIKCRGFQTNSGLRACRRDKSRTPQRLPLFRSETDSDVPSGQLEPSKLGEEEDTHVSQNNLRNSSSGHCQRRRYPTRSNRGWPSKKSHKRPFLGERRLNIAVDSRPEIEGNSSFDVESEGESLHWSAVGTMPRLKSILSTPGVRQQHKTPNRVAFVKRLNRSSGERRESLKKDQSLLGYDFIAGVLESDSRKAAMSDQFFEEICQFRQLHREQCVHDHAESFSDPSVQNPSEDRNDEKVLFNHKCIHNYKVNQRLFPVPSNESRDGESLCAVCQSRRDSTRSTRLSPSYIRVSIPRSTLVSPYRVRPHRRRSFDPTDSLGISKHCISGWQCSKPSMMPTAGSLDIHESLSSTAVKSNFHPKMENLPPTATKIPKTSHRT